MRLNGTTSNRSDTRSDTMTALCFLGEIYRLSALLDEMGDDMFRDVLDICTEIWNETCIYDPQADANSKFLMKLHKQQLQ